jgi:glycosyltransferase involved in cell wall biosynthesis
VRVGKSLPAFNRYWDRSDHIWLDRYVSRRLPPCDIFCGLSGFGLRTGTTAQKNGVKYVCDRGSSHIRYQARLLKEEYGAQGISYASVDPWIIDREEAEYEQADAITVPSTFALRSFIAEGVSRRKMRLAPYGVDLARFTPAGSPPKDQFRVLFVGSISVRKGVHYLFDAFARLRASRKKLTVIGTIEPSLLAKVRRCADNDSISLLGHIPQSQLKYYMSTHHVLVLPSIEEGLAMVQAQAMACGCPVIATTNTGASDLFEDGKEGFIVPIRDSQAIADRLQHLADDPCLQQSMSAASLARVAMRSGWQQYGSEIYRAFRALARS